MINFTKSAKAALSVQDYQQSLTPENVQLLADVLEQGYFDFPQLADPVQVLKLTNQLFDDHGTYNQVPVNAYLSAALHAVSFLPTRSTV